MTERITINGIIKEIVKSSGGSWISYFILETSQKEIFKVKCFGISATNLHKEGDKVFVEGDLEDKPSYWRNTTCSVLNDSRIITPPKPKPSLTQTELNNYLNSKEDTQLK